MNKLWIILSLIIISIVVCVVLVSPPGINQLKNDPTKFRFNHFYTTETFTSHIDVLLREGMREEEVDKIFIEHAGAEKFQQGDFTIYRKNSFWACPIIRKSSEPNWEFKVKYDQNQRIENFQIEEVMLRFIVMPPCI